VSKSLSSVEIVEPWHEVSLEKVNKRTQVGQAVSIGLRHGWVVKAARTVSRTPDSEFKNGKPKPGKTEEHIWVGGAKPGFEKPEKVFLANALFMKKNMQHCTFTELKQFILEN